MANIAKVAQKALDDATDKKIRLTFATLDVQWWINKQKNSEMDYSHRVQFARFKLERVSGKKVKMNMGK